MDIIILMFSKKIKYLNITVLIPCYNGEHFIRRALDSIVTQYYDLNFIKIIVLNDGSTDNTLNLLNEYKSHFPDILEILTVPNGGIAHSRKIMIEAVKTEYFIFLDADDYFASDALYTFVKNSKNGVCDMVTSKC
jgi:glycosyltransferase involved in cell wall biosynthesis